MNSFTKYAAIAGLATFAAGSAAWAQASNPNPGTPEPYATSPGAQTPGQGLTPFERAKQELRKSGYKDTHDWKKVENGWSAGAVRNGQNVRVVISDKGQIAASPAR